MEKLTQEQISFLQAEGKVVVIACPGSGKTYSVASKLLSYNDNWNSYHQGVAVLSFTNIASEEIYKKAIALNKGVGQLDYPHYIGTVDSFINEFIIFRYGYLMTHEHERPLVTLNDRWKLPYRFWRKECHTNGCVNGIENFQWGIDNKFYKGKERVICELRGKAKLLPCEQYKLMLWNKNILFQNEVASFAYRLLKMYPNVAKALAERFPIIMIDEAQDTSEEQMAVFEILSDAGMKSMFLIGDPDQAIYEWRNANVDCFRRKLEESSWDKISFTGNFRSSQNICNATALFSNTLKGNSVNEALGEYRNEVEKPVLLLTHDNSEQEIVDYFLEKCKKMNITIDSEHVAVLTRGRIHSDTDIPGLWQSIEIELFARAVYEWNYGSRKKAYNDMTKASFRILIGEETDEYQINQTIEKEIGLDIWKDFVIEVLCEAPETSIGIGDWVKQFTNVYENILNKYHFKLLDEINLKEIFKLKSRDTRNPLFKEIPLINFFEKKSSGDYTRSSIHGVKGETYDAVLIYIKSNRGNTLTPKFLMEGDLDNELMRIAYVAMTRPRRLLMIAMPESKKIKEYSRFPKDRWNYIYFSDINR